MGKGSWEEGGICRCLNQDILVLSRVMQIDEIVAGMRKICQAVWFLVLRGDPSGAIKTNYPGFCSLQEPMMRMFRLWSTVCPECDTSVTRLCAEDLSDGEA